MILGADLKDNRRPAAGVLNQGRKSGHGHFSRGKNVAVVAALLLIVLLVGMLLWQRAQPVIHVLDGWTMGSTWRVSVVGPRDFDTAALKAGIEAQFQALDQQLSGYRAGTGLSQVNAAPLGTWVALPPDLAIVLRSGLDLWRESGGAFDMTVRPLVLLWGFGAAEPRDMPPTPAQIAAAKARLGSDRVELSEDGTRIRRLSDVSLDVDAIAPGHAADVIAAWLVQRGLHDTLVDVGGELRASGHRPDGTGWRVGIERPQLAHGDVTRVIAVSGLAIATSGDYRDYFELAGKRYAHTLDPVTGQPADNGLASVTVLAPSALAADGYATALMVLGPDQGMAWAEKYQLPVFMILRTGNEGFIERYNERFAPYLVD
ncbi:MAG: FAD:protein FMN transferase [Pseudomonadota bacterium]